MQKKPYIKESDRVTRGGQEKIFNKLKQKLGRTIISLMKTSLTIRGI